MSSMKSKVSPEANFQEMLPVWISRHKEIRGPYWGIMRLLFRAKYYGPETIAGPAVVVPTPHTRSSDPPLFLGVKSYAAPVARDDNTILSKSAARIGGPISPMGGGREGMEYFLKHVKFILESKMPLLVFPATDVHDGQMTHNVLKRVVTWQLTGKIGDVAWWPATIRYSSPLPRVAQMRVFPSYWPIPWLTLAESFISREPVRISDLPRPQGSVDQIVDSLFKTLFEKSASLPEYYLGKRPS